MAFTFFSDNVFMNISAVVLLVLFLFLFFIFLVFLLSLIKKKRYYGGFEPHISLIIPAYNEEKNIASCLRSIYSSDYPKEKLEVIVVDDGSTDRTVQIAKGFDEVKVIGAEHKGKVEALNKGVKMSSYSVIMSVDSDVELDKDAIKNMVLPLFEDDVAATNAVVLTKAKLGVMRLFQYVEYYYNNLIRVSFSRLFDNSIWFFGAVACYKRSALQEIGGFKKDTLTEDMDVCLELYRHGYRIITLKEARIYTDALSLLDFIDQRMRWYYGALQGLYKNRKLFRSNIRSVPVVFLFLNQYWWTFYAIVSIPIIVYQVWYWWPQSGIFGYLFRWFSLAGPAYVFYKIPDGWLSFLNVSGVSAGILTALMIILSFLFIKKRIPIRSILPMFFYFPFTIVLNLAILLSLFKYLVLRRKVKYFIE